MSKYLIPDGMLQAGRGAYDAYVTAEEGSLRILEAGAKWLSENPIVPTPEQLQSIADKNNRGKSYPEAIEMYVIGFQKIMFLKAEPEMIGEETVGQFCARHQTIGKAVIEAYRRGKESK